MLEKRTHPANKDGLSLITRSLLFCLLSALWDLTVIALMIALIVMSIFRLQSTVK